MSEANSWHVGEGWLVPEDIARCFDGLPPVVTVRLPLKVVEHRPRPRIRLRTIDGREVVR